MDFRDRNRTPDVKNNGARGIISSHISIIRSTEYIVRAFPRILHVVSGQFHALCSICLKHIMLLLTSWSKFKLFEFTLLIFLTLQYAYCYVISRVTILIIIIFVLYIST